MKFFPFVFLATVVGVLLAVYFYGVSENSDATSLPPVMSIVTDNGALNFKELDTYWSYKIDKLGGVKAYTEFLEAYSVLNINRQHELAHVFGEALYKIEGLKGVAVCDRNFGFGCYHSFFGWAIQDRGLEVLPELDLACIEVYGEKGLGCQHGIGHGVLAEQGRGQLSESLEACSRLSWKEPIGGCTSGVFMEYNFGTMEDNVMREVTNNNQYQPCTEVADKFKEACYFEMPSWWVAGPVRNYEKAGLLCEGVKIKLHREACYRGAGNTFAGLLVYEFADISKACLAMPSEEGEILCIEGATWIVSAQAQFEDTWRDLCLPYEDRKDYYERCIRSHDFI